jgi:hypothetical protein
MHVYINTLTQVLYAPLDADDLNLKLQKEFELSEFHAFIEKTPRIVLS